MSEQRHSRLSAFQRWSRNTFTREKLADNLKSFLWVAPLTVLIWVYAEREQINPDFKVNDVTIQLVNNDQSRFVEAVGTTQPRVNLTLSGPLSNLERVHKQLATEGIPIDLGKLLGPGNGQRSVNVVDRIQDDPRLREAGVSVVSSQPTELTIDVEAMRSEPVEVKWPPTVQNLDMSKTYLEPKQVQISGPESDFADAKSLVVYADLAGSPILSQPGPHDLIDVPLKIDQPHFTISPSTVKAHLEVRSTDVTWTIPSVSIVVQAPVTMQKTCYIDAPLTVPNVSVVGPPQMKGQFAEAVLKVTNDDIVGSEISRQLIYNLPPGVRLSSDNKEALQDVKFTISARSGG
jgi:hypothetical protein